MLDIFNDDAFQLTSLTDAINDDIAVPGQLTNSGLFQEDGITTTTFSIEKDGKTLSLVPTQSRGGPGMVVEGTKRQMIPFQTVHLPQQASLMADSIQGIRAFGSESQTQVLSAEVNKRFMAMRRNLDATLEHMRVGALTGKVMDADGTTELLDIYSAFGLTQTEFAWEINSGTTNVTSKCRALWDLMEDEMDGIQFTGIRVYCGRTFYNTLVAHEDVEKKFELWNAGQFNRDVNNQNFTFGEIEFVKYRGQVGGNRFIGDNDCYIVATGVPDLFIGRFAPANYNETVNTVGRPYYAKMETMPFDKGMTLEAQSNPMYLSTRPQAIIKGRIGV